LNFSNDLSNDLIDLGRDKNFLNAFSHDPKRQQLKPQKGEEDGSKIYIRDDDFLKFDSNEKPEDDSLPLSGSIAFGDNPGNLSTLLEQGNLFSKQMSSVGDKEKPARLTRDAFHPQEKLFLNDMSNILQVEHDAVKVVDTLENQLQSTLILDAEDECEEINQRQDNKGMRRGSS